MKQNNVKLDFNDVLIVPKKITEINTRSLVNPYIHNKLPLITAPMDTVISLDNMSTYLDNKINTCLPRNIKSNIGFKSYSISQITSL